MNPRTAITDRSDARLTDTGLNAALRDDTILPSSGFAGSVMAAVESRSTAPEALAFPWKRALPGLVAAFAVLALLAGVLISAAARAMHAGPRLATAAGAANPDWQLQLQPLVHGAVFSGGFWLVLVFVLSGLCLLLCRRLVSWP